MGDTNINLCRVVPGHCSLIKKATFTAGKYYVRASTLGGIAKTLQNETAQIFRLRPYTIPTAGVQLQKLYHNYCSVPNGYDTDDIGTLF